LKLRVKNCLADFKSRDHMIRVPLSTFKKSLRENKKIDLPQIELCGLKTSTLDETVYTPLDDILIDICEDDIDKIILNLRMEGVSLEGTGKAINKSRQWVFCRLKKLKRNYLNTL